MGGFPSCGFLMKINFRLIKIISHLAELMGRKLLQHYEEATSVSFDGGDTKSTSLILRTDVQNFRNSRGTTGSSLCIKL